MSEHKRKATIWFVILFLAGGMAGLWFYLDWLWRACGGVGGEGC